MTIITIDNNNQKTEVHTDIDSPSMLMADLAFCADECVEMIVELGNKFGDEQQATVMIGTLVNAISEYTSRIKV